MDRPWIQVSSATVDLKAASSAAMALRAFSSRGSCGAAGSSGVQHCCRKQFRLTLSCPKVAPGVSGCYTVTNGRVMLAKRVARLEAMRPQRRSRLNVCAAYVPLIFLLRSADLLLGLGPLSSPGSPGRGHCEAIAGWA